MNLKQITRGVSVKQKDRLQLRQDTCVAGARPKYEGRASHAVSQHRVASLHAFDPGPCRWGRKSLFSDMQILCSSVFSPLRNMFYFLWGKKKINVKAIYSQNNFANVCSLLPFKPIKYLSLHILSIEI